MRQELVQRRIEQPDRDRQPLHGLEQLDEIAALHRQELVERFAPRFLVVGEDHLAHRLDARLVKEHVLGAAEADAFGAELDRDAGVRRRIGIGAHAQRARLVGPSHQRAELARHRRFGHRHGAGQHLPGRAVDGDGLAALEHGVARLQGLRVVIDPERARAGDAGLAHAARDHGRVRGHAAARRQDALGGVHAVDVLRRSLDPNQNDLLAVGLELGRLVGIEHDLAGGRARRRRQAVGDHVALGLGIDGRMQQLVERAGLDPRHRLFLR